MASTIILPPGSGSDADYVYIGGRVFKNLNSLLYLYAATAGVNQNCTVRTSNTATGYQVTSGKTLTIGAIRMSLPDDTTSTNNTMIIGYADNDLGFTTTTAPINPVYLAGQSANGQQPFPTFSLEPYLDTAMFFQIPAGKFPFILNIGGASGGQQFILFGSEA